MIIAARLSPSAIPLNRENAMRVPTLSAVRELDFIESLKVEGMTHPCRVKSVNVIVTRVRHRMCAQPLFQRWTLRAAIFVTITFLAVGKARIIAVEFPVAPL
ncbi:MAG TPA: hypothetical protein VGG72_07715 [Bryobacteraceae bacterium]